MTIVKWIFILLSSQHRKFEFFSRAGFFPVILTWIFRDQRFIPGNFNFLHLPVISPFQNGFCWLLTNTRDNEFACTLFASPVVTTFLRGSRKRTAKRTENITYTLLIQSGPSKLLQISNIYTHSYLCLAWCFFSDTSTQKRSQLEQFRFVDVNVP